MAPNKEFKVHITAALIAMYPMLILSIATLIFALINSDLWLFSFIGIFYFMLFRDIDQIRAAHLKKYLLN
ncbi:hypothetical protein NSQ54_03495 [Alkalihalobacillus sp. FSL W8-0930]